ncbi:MAG: Stp1/IreP family PP2C-type Ser/Thr phosphatase [Gorillibacterium sp.]|nr:Stp1/IreP family PP2C-type Ser/Thr phosphatase [Gorillibacterium sp.]
MRTASRTDIGNIRIVNEDRSLVVPDLQGFTLGIVADGMGGHQAGDTASQLAVELIHKRMLYVEEDMTETDCERLLIEAVSDANRRIYEMAGSREQFNGMGTTVVVVLARQTDILVAHIGDSRAYLLQDGELRQLTEDHSLVNELVKSGQLSREEAERHPRRNVLTRALGTDVAVETEIRRYIWKSGDVILICSDGLSGLVPESRLRSLVHADEDLEQVADELVHSALEAGGDDNVTVVLIENVPTEMIRKGG